MEKDLSTHKNRGPQSVYRRKSEDGEHEQIFPDNDTVKVSVNKWITSFYERKMSFIFHLRRKCMTNSGDKLWKTYFVAENFLCPTVLLQSLYVIVYFEVNYFQRNRPIGQVVERSPMGRESGVPPQFESCQKLKKSYLIPSCLTLSVIRYVSKIKWSNPGKGIAPSPTPQCSSYISYSRRLLA